MKKSSGLLKYIGLPAIVAMSFLFSTQSFAALVTITASGETNFVSQPALNSLLGKQLIVTAVYSTDVSDSNPDTSIGNYSAGLVSFSATLDGQILSSLSPSSSSVTVGNDRGDPFYDDFGIGSFSTGLTVSFPGLGPYDRATTFLVLRDTTSSVFTNDSLLTAFTLADFDLPFISVNLQPETNSFNTRVDATITSLSVSVEPVPLPPSLLLLGSGVAWLALFRRKRKA